MIACVSNIAWTVPGDGAAEGMLLDLGLCSLELAPTRYWPDLSAVTESEARLASSHFLRRGFSIAAFQAVLFGQPSLQVFGIDNGKACLDYLNAVCRLAGWMGAGAVVMGSPKNRLRGSLTPSAAMAHAVDFFRRLGDTAAAAGTRVCLEPNPAVYGADFLLDTAETAAMVQAVDSPGIALNFDMGEQAIHHADAAAQLRACFPLVGHFHVSEPMLEPFDPTRAAHREAAAVLQESGYTGAVSLEMKCPAGGLPAVHAALRGMKDAYQL